MKATSFLKLVGEMRSEQIAFFAEKNIHPIQAREHLIRAKQLEKQVDAVVQEGLLEPDEAFPTAFLESMEGEPGEGIQIGMFEEKNDDEAK